MTKSEYMKMAEEAGYSEEEIRDLVDFHEESGIPFGDLPLMERIVD